MVDPSIFLGIKRDMLLFLKYSWNASQMRVIIVEPFNMERHCCWFLCITSVTKNFLNEILHVIATSGIGRYAH